MDTGEVESDRQALNVYRKITIIAVIVTLVLLPLIGMTADRISSSILFPLAFLLRGIAAFSFQYLSNPRSDWAIFVAISLIVTTLLQNVTVIALFTRNMPSDIRGAMNGLFHFFGLGGLTVYTMCAGVLFDKVGPASPFTFVSCCDCGILLISIVISCLGYLK